MAGSGPSSVLLLSLAMLAGCTPLGPVDVPLTYEPTGAAPVPLAMPVVAVGLVSDERGPAPDELGVATGDLGFPTRPLASEPPVARAVREALTAALMARELLAPPGHQRFDLAVRIVRLEAAEGRRQRTDADFVITLMRHGSERIIYTDEVRAIGGGRSPVSLDTAGYVPLASVAELTRRAMSLAIEQAVDKPGFQAAVHG